MNKSAVRSHTAIIPQNDMPDLGVSFDQYGRTKGGLPVSSLQRQGFFVSEAQFLHIPAKWQAKLLAKSKKDRDQTYILLDQRGARRGVMTASMAGIEHNTLSLTPRFSLAIEPGPKDSTAVYLNDGGLRKHLIAQTETTLRKPRKLDIAAVATHVTEQTIPGFNNPLTHWDMQSGHAKKLVIHKLRDAFALTAGFVEDVTNPPVTTRNTPKARLAKEELLWEQSHLKAGMQDVLELTAGTTARDTEFPLYKQGLG